jgi:hypothetical protein
LLQGHEKSSKKMPEHYKKRIIELAEVLSRNPIPAELYDIIKLGGVDES